MKFNECQKSIIHYIVRYYKDPDRELTPCIEVFNKIFKGKYSNLEIEENVGKLISSGIIKPHGFHSYLKLTETFKSSNEYKLFREKIFKV